MPSSELQPLEVEENASTSEFMPVQVVNLDNKESVSCQQVLPSAASPAKQPLDGPDFESSSCIQVSRNTPENSSTTIVSSNHGYDVPKEIINRINDPLPTNILRLPDFIPSFSYNIAPQMVSPTAPPEQSPSDSITGLTAPMSPASLQPPVPGQSSGNKPFFSFNVVPHANISPAPGQQFQHTTATNQSQPQVGNLPMFMYSQPSDPEKPAGIGSKITGGKALPVPFQNNVDTKAVLVSTSSNNPTCLDPGITSKLARPSFNASPRMPGIFGSSRPHGSLPSRPLSSNVAGHPMVPDSYASNKSFPPSSYSATPNSVSFNGQPNLYQPPNQYLHPAATPSPASWLQHGVVHNPPFLTYPGLMVAPSPFQYGIPSHTPIRPTGLSTPSTSVEKSSFATEKTILPPSDLDKQTDSLKNNEVCIANNVINAWMAHKTEEGVIYYYNSLTRVSTYDKPLCFKLEPDRIASQPTPVSWERLSGTDWTLVRTNDGKKYYYDTKNKAVPSHATRRSLFEHYVRTRAEEERKEKRMAQKAAIEGFKKLLEEALEDINKRINYHTFKKKWGNDSRFEALNYKDRELFFNERILALKKASEQKIQATRAVVVSEFESMLKDSCHITASSRWSMVKDSFRNDPRYNSIKHEEREALFNEYLSKLKALKDESEIAANAEREEQDKLKKREQEMRKRKQRDEQEMESLRLKILKKEAETSYHALLVETIKDPKASWTESKPKLEKDPQGRFTSCNLVQADLENIFRVHVKSLYGRCVQDFCTMLTELITPEAALSQVTDKEQVFRK